ncbi:MAG: MATE family efflux transporter [Synergistes sp.]|nr:MATE family efflux transporter [Synergistes sp.]
MKKPEFLKGIFTTGARPLTEGNIPLLLTRYAIPFLIANFMQALYGAVDMIIVGQFTNAAGLSAVSIGSQFIFMINNIVIGFSIGGSVMIGHAFGGGRKQESSEIISTMLSLFLLMSAAVALILPFFADSVLTLLGTPADAFSEAKGYIIINEIGIVTMFYYNALSAIFRGFGDSASPLIFIAVACVANILGDLVLVAGIGMGAKGAALATVAAQGFSVMLSLRYARHGDYGFDFRLSSLHINRAVLKRMLRIALPMSLQFSMTSISFIFIMATVSRMGGVAASAAIGITSKINAFTMLPPMSFTGAISGTVAQNMGAGKPHRARTALFSGIAISLCFGIATFIGLFFFPKNVIRIFTPDKELISATALYLRSFSLDCILVCFVFCTNGFFNGCGKTAFTMLNNTFSAFAVRVPATWILSSIKGASLFSVGFAAPLASLQTILFSLLYFKSGRWKKKI